MRGIHDSVYSPDKLQATAESFAAFYKTLTESGMPAHLAAQLTQEHFAKLDREVRAQMEHQRPGRRERRTSADARDSLGPDFDPLGPNFDPLKGRGWAERPPAPRPGEPMQPPEPDRRSTP